MSKRIKPPNKDTVAGKNYTYLDCPKSMDECYYELELLDCKLTDNEDKYVCVFKVLETDTKVRPGTEISHMMDPYQKFAETYFWRDMFTIYAVCRGKEADEKLLKKLSDKHEAILAKMVDGAAVGGTCVCHIKSFEKEGRMRSIKTWEPLSA